MEHKRINLALQGGGAHGAFTWGVLDRLLEDEALEIAGISGTSAGALNGAALKSGWMKDRHAGARASLDWLWAQVSGIDDLHLTSWMAPFGVRALSTAIEHSMPYQMGEAFSRMVSPYSYGPLYRNPLADIVAQLDFGDVCNTDGPALFIGATRVRNGKIRVFEGDEITTDAILASACLPTLFQAVEIADKTTGRVEAFWDGGYTGNPALFPLFGPDLPADIVVININPLERDEVPRTPQQIQNRINEISFNSSLLRELRAIEFVQRLLEDGTLRDGRMARVKMHMIADDDLMGQLNVATKVVPNPVVMAKLKEAGRGAADAFLSAHRDDLNSRSTIDLPQMFG